MSALPISARLLLSYLLVAVLPLAGLAAFYLVSFERSLQKTVLANMATIADKKAEQIDSYVAERLADVHLLSKREVIRDGVAKLGQAFRANGMESARYRNAADVLHGLLKSSGAATDFHDLLLMDTGGNVVFSLAQEPDLGTNLRQGPYRNTELARGFELAMQTLQTHLSHFERYAPSADRPAAFLVAPVLQHGRVIGAIGLQLNVDRLMQVTSDRTGLGRTGETVLAQTDGNEAFYTAPLRRVDNAAYRYRVALGEAALPMQHALAGGHSQGRVRDYADIDCVAAWRYLPALGWGMVVKIDAEEALAPAARLRRLTYVALALFLLLSGGAAYFLGRKLSRPIQALTRVADRIAAGDLQPRVPPGDRGELGRLAHAFNHMADALAEARQNLEAQVDARSQELRAVTTLQDAILDQAGALVLVLDREGRIRRFNRACEELSQYAFAEIEGRHVWDFLLPPEERNVVHAEAFDALVRNPHDPRGTFINHWVARDGTRHLVEWTNTLLFDARGEVEFMVSIGIDVTEKKRAETALKESEQRLTEAQRIAQVGSWELELASGKLSCSEEIFRIFEIDRAKFGASYEAFLQAVHPDDRERVSQAYAESLATRMPYEIAHRLRMPDGRIKWVNERCETRYDELGRAVRSSGTVQDITERMEAEAQISRLAYHDALTGLSNRFSLQGQLEQALAMARREQRPLAVVFLDLDRFKAINDTLGHDAGDQLLVEVAHRLRANVRDSDIVARLGGDEFVVVLAEVDDATAAGRVADKILHALAQPYRIGEMELRSTASLGLAFHPDDGEDGETLMKNADTAMYHAKSLGRNNVQFFTAELNQAALKRLTLEHDLQAAVESGQLELHYQPQLDNQSGRVVGVEALVRWRHPRDGLVSPSAFIPVAEETGLILPLGKWVLDEACRQLRAWRDQGLQDVTVAVNLSAHQLHSPLLLQHVSRALDKHGLAGSDLELEITESVAMHDPATSISQLRALRGLGVRLSIDDFGTGYSSLSYLKLLPIHALKLDQSFVRDIETDSNDLAICTATIALAHSLGLAVIAEGVETEAQRELLTSHRCDVVQGYLFSRPLPADAVLAFIQNVRQTGRTAGRDSNETLLSLD
jgi:diguanylate cyclase (GGDEF)-like protein/PAS domain S-box-containing protein